MSWLSIAFLLAAAIFWFVRRAEVLSMHRITLGGNFPMGCVVAEAAALLLIALVALAMTL
jgi:hypothetical protein